MNACELCGYPIGDGNTSEAAGMELCTPCHSGRFGDRLAHRGLRLQCLVKQPHIEGSGGGQATREVVGAIAYDLELRASFSPEDWLAKVGKLFRRELQTGLRGLRIPTDQLDALRRTNPRLQFDPY